MIRAESRLLAEQLEGDALIAQIGDVIVDVIPRALDRGVGRLRSIGTAPPAGPESGAFRRLRGREESDVIALWPPRRTRWAAIDAFTGASSVGCFALIDIFFVARPFITEIITTGVSITHMDIGYIAIQK